MRSSGSRGPATRSADVLLLRRRSPARAERAVLGTALVVAVTALAAAGQAAPRTPGVPACGVGHHLVLAAPPSGKAYAAAFPFFSNERRNEDAVSAQRIDSFEQLASRPLAWGYFSNHWLRGRIRFPTKAVDAIWQHGSMPFVRMMPWSRQVQGEADPIFRMADIAGGRWDAEIAQWADDARRSGIPIMVDFGPEMNGEWFPWNGAYAGELAGAHAYRNAFRHVVTLFRQRGATNVSFAFHIDAEGEPAQAWNDPKQYYPGNAYVDWVGASVYGADTPAYEWTPFSTGLAVAIVRLRSVARGKPFAVFEWGVVEAPAKGDKARWIDNAFRALAEQRFAAVRAVSWWDERWENDDGSWSDLRIDSSPGALAAYRRGIEDPRYEVAPRFACIANS